MHQLCFIDHELTHPVAREIYFELTRNGFGKGQQPVFSSKCKELMRGAVGLQAPSNEMDIIAGRNLFSGMHALAVLLQRCVACCWYEPVKFLLELGADPNRFQCLDVYTDNIVPDKIKNLLKQYGAVSLSPREYRKRYNK